MRHKAAFFCIAAGLLGYGLGVLTADDLHAQQAGIKRMILQKAELADVATKEAVLGVAEVAPGAAAGRHTHFGYELGYVIEGTAVLEVEGEAPVNLKAGDSYTIPAGKKHDARNTSSAPVKVLAVYIVDRGKPLATAAQ
jgi:quercetin dioxygenase-like cupin family protein